MSNDAWADDPDLRVETDDDPDSQRLKKGLGLLFWPRPTLIIIGWLGVILFDGFFVARAVMFFTALWVGAHLLFRPKKFFIELRAPFAAGAAFMAKYGAPLFAWLNRMAKAKKREATPQPATAAQPAAYAIADDAPAPRPRASRFDWSKLGFLLNPKVIIGILILMAAIGVLRGCDAINPFAPPSGAEVAAQANANTAEANQRTAEAETNRSGQSVVIVEENWRTRARVRNEVEEGREAIAQGPDLDTRYREYRDRVLRLRNASDAAVATAVQQHVASDAP